jgi:membrane associated rhomboid family serine protease
MAPLTERVLSLAKGDMFLAGIIAFGGFTHMVGNLFVLALATTDVHIELGCSDLAVLAIYIVTGLGASFTSLLAKGFQGSDIPSIGASGAVSGMVGLIFVVNDPTDNYSAAGVSWQSMFLIFMVSDLLRGIVQHLLVGPVLRNLAKPVQEKVEALLRHIRVIGVDWAAHIGGSLTGMAIGFMFFGGKWSNLTTGGSSVDSIDFATIILSALLNIFGPLLNIFKRGRLLM